MEIKEHKTFFPHCKYDQENNSIVVNPAKIFSMYVSDKSTEHSVIYQLHWIPPVENDTLKELHKTLLMIIIHDSDNPLPDIKKEIYKWTRVYCGTFKELNITFEIPEEYIAVMAEKLLPVIRKCQKTASE